MPESERQLPLAARQCRYTLPDDLEFAGLAPSQGREIIRIRFSRGRGTTVDLPLSAETLAALVQPLSSLHGRTPSQLPDELEHLRLCGGVLDT